jgi:hypothetical protein
MALVMLFKVCQLVFVLKGFIIINRVFNVLISEYRLS